MKIIKREITAVTVIRVLSVEQTPDGPAVKVCVGLEDTSGKLVVNPETRVLHVKPGQGSEALRLPPCKVTVERLDLSVQQ